MPQEHLNERGELVQGYYCSRCGQPAGMYGHKLCEKVPGLDLKLSRINEAGSLEQYTFNKLKGEYDRYSRKGAGTYTVTTDRYTLCYFNISTPELVYKKPLPARLAWTQLNTTWQSKRKRT